MLKRKPLLIIIGVLLISLSISACGTKDSGQDKDNNKEDIIVETEEKDKDDDRGSDDGEGDILEAEEAYNIFMEKYPQAKIDKFELDYSRDGSLYEYKIEGYDEEFEYELKLNASNGDIIKEEKDGLDDNYGEIGLLDIEKAESLVRENLEKEGQNAKIDEWTVEMDDGVKKIEIELVNADGKKVEYKEIID